MSDKIGVKEAADILGVSKKTIYSRLRSGKIAAEKVDTKHGKKWLINKEKLEQAATTENEVIEVKEINRLIEKEQLLDDLVNSISEKNKDDIKNISSKLQELNQKLIKENQELIRENEKLKQQLDQLQKKLNKGFKEKLKELFKG